MTQKLNLGHIESDIKVSRISRSPLIDIKLKQGSVSKNLLSLVVHSLELGLYSLFTVSQAVTISTTTFSVALRWDFPCSGLGWGFGISPPEMKKIHRGK